MRNVISPVAKLGLAVALLAVPVGTVCVTRVYAECSKKTCMESGCKATNTTTFYYYETCGNPAHTMGHENAYAQSGFSTATTETMQGGRYEGTGSRDCTVTGTGVWPQDATCTKKDNATKSEINCVKCSGS